MTDTHSYHRKYDPSVYDREYYEGDGATSGYDNYLNTENMLRTQYRIISDVMGPRVLSTKTDNDPASIIDAACAYGFGLNELASRGWSTYGFDVSEFAIEKAIEINESRGGNINELMQGDALDFNVWQALPQVDLITAVEFFEHIQNVDVQQVLMLMQKQAKWGLFVVNASTHPDPKHDTDGDHGHLNHNSMTWWIKKVSKYGQIDYDAMFTFSKLALELEPAAHWQNRCIVVKFTQ